ncbi:MAG: PDZ domain-containing protein [Clostridia bacterium]|nr:PDZ domain-containing protein [Clostridia bacterium]
MKRISKIMTAWILTLVMACSCVTVWAEDTAESIEQEYKYSDYVKSIAKQIALLGRYNNLVENNLYLAAIEAVLEENPELYDVAVKAMLEQVDENSVYYNEEEAKAFMESLDDEVVGIGVTVLDRDGYIMVSQPIPGSPAHKAGIKSGDIIRSADGVALDGLSLDEAVEFIRGKEGTKVIIDVQRSGLDGTIPFEIIREKVMSPSLDFELIEKEDKKIAKITIYSFTENVAVQFKEALEKADAAGTKNLIIDLRDNGGGYLSQAVAIADMLLPAGKIITTEDHKLDVLDMKYESTGIGKEYEIIVLINEMSASASEVLTAALIENEAAIAVGTKSFGKGTVQAVYDTPKNGVMKFTVAYYLTPNGNNIHEKGITPHTVIENSEVPVDMSQFELFTYSNKYRLGDTGSEVENAKKMLEMLGIYIGEINDVYDENLKGAVAVFQEAMNLYSYGVLDFSTQMNLYEKLKSMKVEVDDQLEAAIDSF